MSKSVSYSVVPRKNPQEPEAGVRFYAQSQASGDVTVREMSERIQRTCTVTRADVAAVLTALEDVIVEALSDNRNRTAADVRHYFDKFGKGMGAQGCVSWSFDRKGVIVISNEDEELDEDTVMMDALDAGAEDMEADGPVFEVTTDPDSFNDVVKALEEKGYTFESAEIEMVPQNYITMTSEDDVRSMTKLLDMLDDNEDVQNVWHNWQQD